MNQGGGRAGPSLPADGRRAFAGSEPGPRGDEGVDHGAAQDAGPPVPGRFRADDGLAEQAPKVGILEQGSSPHEAPEAFGCSHGANSPLGDARAPEGGNPRLTSSSHVRIRDISPAFPLRIERFVLDIPSPESAPAALADLIAAGLVSHEMIGDPGRLGGEAEALRTLCGLVSGSVWRIEPFHYAFRGARVP